MGGFKRIITHAVGMDPPVIQEVQKPYQAVTAPKGPTVAEINQRRIGINRRGRRATILTSTKGVDEDLTLGTKNLLG